MSPTIVFFISNVLLSGQDSLTSCQVNSSGQFENCKYVKEITNLQLSNPNGLSYYNDQLYVSNYGKPFSIGTSYMFNCHTNNGEITTCSPFLALASAYHISGVKSIKDKLFFISSYPLQNTVINYLVACNYPATSTSRLGDCGIPVLLNSQTGTILQNGFNNTMDISILNYGPTIQVTDRAKNSFYECTYPDAANAMTCTDTSSWPSEERSRTQLTDIKSNYTCRVFSNENKNYLNCCSLTAQKCYTMEGGTAFTNPTSLSIDEINGFVYLANGSGNTFTSCRLGGEKADVVHSCTSFTPTYTDGSKAPSVVSKILVTP